MRSLRTFFEFYINSSIHVALAVVSLSVISFLDLEIPISQKLLIFTFFGTITGYNFVKYAGIAKLHHSGLAKSLQIIQVFSFLSFIILVWAVFKVDQKVLFWTAFFGIFTLLYALPVFSKRRNLRSISGIKIFIIALVWAGVTVILPAVSAGLGLGSLVLIEFLQRFLLVLVLILPFEIRDLKYDLEQLGTIPQKVGVTKTKVLGIILLIVMLLLETFKNNRGQAEWAAFLLMLLVAAFFTWRSKERQSKYYASFWVEGIPIFWLLSLLVFKSL
ncbi:MAG: hypothetical protein WBL27_06345 [Salinimicrobium sp.]